MIKAITHKYKRTSITLLMISSMFIGLNLSFYTSALAFENRTEKRVKQSAQTVKEKADNITLEKTLSAIRDETEAIANAENFEQERQLKASNFPFGTIATGNCDTTDLESIKVVINKKHCISPKDWVPDDLVSVMGVELRKEAASYLEAMAKDASSEGLIFSVSSGHRGYYDQAYLYEYWSRQNDSPAEADSVSARPGYSEHHTGLAVDLMVESCTLECFGTTEQYKWLKANAQNYGFIERYPDGLASITGYQPETWHWRYVGIEIAKDMKAKGIKTLEKYLNITGGDY